LADTPYSELTEELKQKDRDEVMPYWKELQQHDAETEELRRTIVVLTEIIQKKDQALKVMREGLKLMGCDCETDDGAPCNDPENNGCNENIAEEYLDKADKLLSPKPGSGEQGEEIMADMTEKRAKKLVDPKTDEYWTTDLRLIGQVKGYLECLAKAEKMEEGIEKVLESDAIEYDDAEILRKVLAQWRKDRCMRLKRGR